MAGHTGILNKMIGNIIEVNPSTTNLDDIESGLYCWQNEAPTNGNNIAHAVLLCCRIIRNNDYLIYQLMLANRSAGNGIFYRTKGADRVWSGWGTVK